MVKFFHVGKMMITMKRSLPLLLFMIFFSGVLMGCGYHLRATGEPMGIKLESLAIPLMSSTSSDKGFEADFTRMIRQEFIGHAKVPLLPREEAQAVLIGKIYDTRFQPLTYNLQQQTIAGEVTTHEVTSSRRMRIILDVQLTDRATGKVIWHDKSMKEEASFIVGTDPLANRYYRQQALQKIARRFAKRIYLKTMERF